jgi:hypothetical protein
LEDAVTAEQRATQDDRLPEGYRLPVQANQLQEESARTDTITSPCQGWLNLTEDHGRTKQEYCPCNEESRHTVMNVPHITKEQAAYRVWRDPGQSSYRHQDTTLLKPRGTEEAYLFGSSGTFYSGAGPAEEFRTPWCERPAITGASVQAMAPHFGLSQALYPSFNYAHSSYQRAPCCSSGSDPRIDPHNRGDMTNLLPPGIAIIYMPSPPQPCCCTHNTSHASASASESFPSEWPFPIHPQRTP